MSKASNWETFSARKRLIPTCCTLGSRYVSWADGTLQTFNDILLGDATKEAAFAIKQSAELEKEAAQLRQDTVLIEQSFAWRSLSRNDEKLVSKRLWRITNQSFRVSYDAGNVEAAAFAWDVARALDKAQLNVEADLKYGVLVTNSGDEEQHLGP